MLLNELVTHLFNDWQPQMEKKGLQYMLNVPAEDMWIYGDLKNLYWAFENVMSNARNYTPEDGKVTVSLYAQDGEAILEIRDSGVGIAAADQEYIFAGFFRAENDVNYAERGIGLGLFIARSILELHNGRIWVNSQLNNGSIFSCALPLDEANV